MPDQSTQSAQEAWDEFIKSFCQVASFQGRFAYCLMSLYASNPYIFSYFTSADLYPFLRSNMLYGITIMIISRPALKSLMPFHRFTFSLLGSLAFNYSSIMWFQWVHKNFMEQTFLSTFLGYLGGRIMMIHLIAFLYHIDTRCTDVVERPRRISVFEAMYS